MNKEQDGGTFPANARENALNPTYTMAEETKDGFVDLFDSLTTLGLLTEAAASGCGPDISLSGLAPLHRSLANLGQHLLGDVATRFPKVREPVAQ